MWASSASALTLPERPSGPINDYAHVLSAEQLSRLDAEARSYEQGTRQIAVAIFKSLDGEAIEDISEQLAEKWKIGGKKNSDGAVMTVFIDDHKIWIATGYGLEATLTDAACARIIRDVIAPRFRAGDVAGGLSAGLAAIDTTITGRAHAGGAPIATTQHSSSGSGMPIGLIVLVFIVVIVIAVRSRGGGGGFGGGLLTGMFLGGGGGWSSGGGGGGGGGWSGGGGSFGGGGAGGSW